MIENTVFNSTEKKVKCNVIQIVNLFYLFNTPKQYIIQTDYVAYRLINY